MPNSLQKTKLYAPAARARLVERPRLTSRLNALRSDGCKAALISAPAGSGKTTLAQQWLSGQTGWAMGWVSLDERDNRPAQFFGYLIAALQAVLPGAGSQSLALLQLPGANLTEVLTLLVNDLVSVPQPFILTLDDFHTISNPELLAAFDHLLDAQPPQMRMILLTREDPVLQLARRRVQGEIVELRQEDLRFTLPETVDFFNQCMDLHLTTGQVERLETRTEGWIAGLQMAALSLQHAPDIDRFINEFSGSHRFILDYLMEEVFTNQAQEIQKFLLETAVLDRMCAGLCAAVTGSSPDAAQKTLEGLEKANLFVFALDDQRHWYRYHHLFHDLLLARLHWQHPEQAARLLGSASDWYEDNGDARQAVEFAIKAGDMSRAANLIELHVPVYWQTADLEFMSLVNRLPIEAIFKRPSLCVHSAWMCVITGQIRRILPFVEAAEQQLSALNRKPSPGDDANRAFVKILRAYLADYENRPVQIDNSMELAYEAIPQSNAGMRNSIAVVLGTLYYMDGDFDLAMHYYQDAIDRDKRVDGANAIPICVLRMVWVLQKQGRLREALARITENERYVRQRGNRRFYIAGVLNLTWAEILLEWNRLAEAETQLREGLHLMEDWPTPQVFSIGYSLLARLQIAQNDLPAARIALVQSEELQRNNDFHPEFIYAVERAQVQLWKVEHNQPALEAFVRAVDHPGGQEFRFRHESRLIERCRARLALDRHAEAATLLEQLLQSTGDRLGSRITILVLLVSAYSNEPAKAEAALDEALRLAAPEGYIRTFVEVGESLRQTLQGWLQRHHDPVDHTLAAYARQVLQAFEKPAKIALIAPELPVSLSRREQEVLQFMAQGLTNQQIADRLFISVRTVKKHVENIHGKLGVQNRTEAAARAHALGLLNT
jgi:LuxR family transcriptional regulator, maltose regulon positive regulatory protein